MDNIQELRWFCTLSNSLMIVRKAGAASMYNVIESVSSYRSDKQPPPACTTDCCVHETDLSNKIYKYTVEERKYQNIQKITSLTHLHGSITI